MAEVFPGMTDICLMLQRECLEGRLRSADQEGAERRLLGRGLDEEADERLGLEHASVGDQIMLTLTNKSDAPWNEAFWKNERFDQLLACRRANWIQAKRTR